MSYVAWLTTLTIFFYLILRYATQYEIIILHYNKIYVEDESYIDMSTAISGSGPAYIFLLIEAMIDAGVDMGFSRETATTLVHQTILGSTMYAMETGEHPAVLRNKVTR